MSNDSFADGAIHIAGSGPSNGSLSLQADGTFQYVPNTGFSGTDTFQYKAAQSWSGLQSSPATVSINIFPFQPFTLEAPQGGLVAPNVQESDLDAIYREAIHRWHTAGVSDEALAARLENVQFIITDLQGSTLSGATADGIILIDVNGAGYGWFIDQTPRSDLEFAVRVSRSELQATSGSSAADHADLLTAVMHEVGHLLGLEHSTGEGGHSVMNATIGLGTRRVPTPEEAALADLLFEEWDRKRRRS